MVSSIRKPRYHCPAEAVVGVLGGRWKLLIMDQLLNGRKRFGELARAIPEASEKMLTAHLRELEEDGLVERTVYYEMPPRVEYQTTDAPEGMERLLAAMHAWGRAYLARRPEKRQAPTEPPPGDR